MDKTARIKALMSNEHSPVRTEAALTAMSDKELDGLEAHVAKKAADIKAAAEKEAADKKAAEEKAEADRKEAAQRAAAAQNQPTPKTEKEWLEQAPKSVRDLVNRAAANEAKTREVLVARLKDAQKEYTEKELQEMPIDQLMRTARLALAGTAEPRSAEETIDFSGLGLPAQEPAKPKPAEIPNGYRSAIERRQKEKVN